MIRWTGARPCEIARLTPERLLVEGEKPYVHYTTGKNGDDRVVPLNSGGLEAARMFIEQNAWGEFSDSSLGKSFKAAYVRSQVTNKATREQRQAALEGIKQQERPTGRTKWRLNPYVLRHTCLTELRKNGADLADVQAIAGHRSISTTMRYAPTVSDKPIDAMKWIDKRAS